MRFAANLSFLFDGSLEDRIDTAAALGFRGVEYFSPYESDLGALADRLRRCGIEQVLFNAPMGAAGERGMACLPDRTDEFRRGIADAVSAARELGCTRVHVLSGNIDANVPPALTHATLVGNMRHAANELAAIGATVMIEPLNPFDAPGYAVSGTQNALALIREIALPNVALQYDIYHAQRTEGELIATLRAHIAEIGHVQIADNPGRHEPGTGEIAFERVLPELDRLGYDSWVGLEYRPLDASHPIPPNLIVR